MKKLFISQPMRGLTDEEILAVRQKAKADAEMLVGEELEVMESFFQGAPADKTPLWYLGESIKLLGQADVVYFADGWENNRGCRVEHLCASEYGKDYIEPEIPSEEPCSDIIFCGHTECLASECARHLRHAPADAPVLAVMLDCSYLPLVLADDPFKEGTTCTKR